MRMVLVSGLVLGVAVPALSAATLTLKDKSSVSGRILAEKKDQIVMDLGFTVLTVPRDNVLKIDNEDEGQSSGAVKDVPPPTVATGASGLYASATTPPAERPVRELVAQLGESVVQVRTPGGLGSGFFITEDGNLITNYHVIEGETKISVEVYHQKNGQLERHSYKDVRIVAVNKFGDLAMLKVEDAGAPSFPRVLLGDTERTAVGERLFAIGSPLGLERTVTEGILSTKTRQLGGDLYLQTTAQINPGNSGGPLFNLRGEVVGVNNMKVTFGEGLGFSIPVEQLKWFLNHRDAFAYDTDNPSNPFRYLSPPSRLKPDVK